MHRRRNWSRPVSQAWRGTSRRELTLCTIHHKSNWPSCCIHAVAVDPQHLVFWSWTITFGPTTPSFQKQNWAKIGMHVEQWLINGVGQIDFERIQTFFPARMDHTGREDWTTACIFRKYRAYVIFCSTLFGPINLRGPEEELYRKPSPMCKVTLHIKLILYRRLHLWLATNNFYLKGGTWNL